MTAPDDLPRSPSGRVPQWVQDEKAGLPPAQTAWRAPTTWSPVAYDTPRRQRRAYRRSRRPRGVAVVVLLAVVGGLWWSWSPENRQTAAEAFHDLRAGAGLPESGLGTQPRRAADGSRLPPAGQEESPDRLLPVVEPGTYSDVYAFTSPSEDALRPYGWSPCRPVHYVVDVTGAPAGFAEDVRAVAGEVSAATGLVFIDDGLVVEAADPAREPHQLDVYGDRWAPVLIRFADDQAVPGLGGDTVGLAGGSMMSGVAGMTHYVSGTVYLDVELLGMPGSGGVPAHLPVLRHELGHLVGLDHVDDPSQLMFPTTGFTATFQAGDLTGLSLVGQAECAPDL